MISAKTLKTLEYDKILSLLSQYATSETGKIELLNLNPSTDYNKAQHFLNMTIEADKILYEHSVGLRFSFSDVHECIMRAKKNATLSMGEILKVGRLLKASRLVMSGITDINDSEITILRGMAEELFVSFTIEKDIFRCILSENEMADNASSELRSIRQSITRCNEKIKDKLNSYITSSSTVKYLQDNIVTMRNDRYVIPVKIEHRGQIGGLVHDHSSSGNTVFVEPMMVVELNNELRMLIASEEKEIYRILREFTTRISLDSDAILYNQKLMTEMDIVFAKALYAKTVKATPPTINSHGKINIIKGKHPLIDQSEVVPVSIRLGDNYRILMITGPNTGGKTVTLKLTGLLTLMGLSGMFIPASHGSVISTFDNMWCDIGDEQSIEQSLSTFSSHMTNIINIVNSLTEKSLILLDEIGAGTDPQEGAALAMAITSYIIEAKAYGVITTHYPELKEYSLITDSIENASMDFDPETFKPTYSLVIGIPGASNAIQIANRLGLNPEIIARAKGLLSDDKISLENVLIQAEKSRRKAEDAQTELEERRIQINRDLSIIDKEKQALIKDREKIQLNAQKEVRRLTRIALEEVNEIVDELKSMLEDSDNIDIFKAHKLRKKLENITVDTENEQNNNEDRIDSIEGDIEVGDRVFVKSINNYGYVESINKKGELTVKIGNISSNIKPNDTIRVKNKEDKKTQKVNVTRPINMGAAKSEINLIGQNADEATYNLDAFINDAFVGGLGEVRIVHGKGQGILRKAIQDYLKDCKLVKEFRKGIFGEGENGVTIVKFK